MSISHLLPPGLPRAASAVSLMMLGVALAGCAQVGESMSSAFADPAKYDLYDCKQLETERKMLSNRAAELQGLMAKAETGTAGVVVAEVAYRNDYVSIRAQQKLAEEAWQRDKCHESPPAAAPLIVPPAAAPMPSAAKGKRSSAR